MNTSKTSILTLAAWIGANRGDATEMDRLFGEVEIELAQDPRWFMLAKTTASATTDETITLTTARALAAIFYNGRQLQEVTREDLMARNRHWRDEVGPATVYLREDVNNETLRFYPRRVNSAETSMIDYLTVEPTTTAIPIVLELPMALFVVAREFSRESNHRDLVFAKECNALGNTLLGMLG